MGWSGWPTARPANGPRGPATAADGARDDGRTVLSYSEDGTVRLWEGLLSRDRDELRENVCRIVGTGLSRSQWTQFGAGVPYRESCP